MGKIFSEISNEMMDWIEHQKVFFVATAPLSQDGHINCSPKGMDSFRVLSPNTVAYLDLTGSGVETIAHLRENARILIMFCAFDGPPQIVRLYGKGEAIAPNMPEFDLLQVKFPKLPGARAIIKVLVSRVSTSCGYGVPLYEYVGNRDVLQKWAQQKGSERLIEYRLQNNSQSIDGLPGLDEADNNKMLN